MLAVGDDIGFGASPRIEGRARGRGLTQLEPYARLGAEGLFLLVTFPFLVDADRRRRQHAHPVVYPVSVTLSADFDGRPGLRLRQDPADPEAIGRVDAVLELRAEEGVSLLEILVALELLGRPGQHEIDRLAPFHDPRVVFDIDAAPVVGVDLLV